MTTSVPKDYDVTFKVLVLGDSGVGKTCLVRRFTDGDFTANFLSTIGIDSKTKLIQVDNVKVRLQIWDTAGQERFRTLTSAYYRGAMGIMLVYEVTNESSFNNISSWLENIEQNTENDVCKIMVGNKCDASVEEREVTESRGSQRAAEFNLPFFEASAKTGTGVVEAFMSLANIIKQRNDIKESQLSVKELSPFQGVSADSSKS
eukprot:gene3623-14857_t